MHRRQLIAPLPLRPQPRLRGRRDCWLMLSGLGKIAKLRWPTPGQSPAFRI
jgi:hypothetical protein